MYYYLWRDRIALFTELDERSSIQFVEGPLDEDLSWVADEICQAICTLGPFLDGRPYTDHRITVRGLIGHF